MSPLPPDPYKVLGVSKDAQTAAIRSAHRKLVLKCHPDKVQDPKLKAEKQDEFQRVQQAYELLIDDAERQKYDEKVKMENLRKNMQTKVHVSTPRSSSRFAGEFEIRTPETRSSAFKSSPSPASPKVFTTFSRGFDDDFSRGPRIFEANIRPSSRREASYADRPSKREMERERERDRERERERDREKERRRKDDDRRAAKAEKEALKAEKKKREKQRDKEIKRDAEEKQRQRYTKPHVEDFEDDEPIPSKKERVRSSSKKDEERREREREREKDRGSPRDPIGRFVSTNERAAYSRASSYMNA